MKLLCLVNPWCRCGGVVEVAVEASGEVALETAADLSVCLAFGSSPVGVGAGLGVMDHADHGDDVQRAVEASVTAAVETVPCGVARGGGDGVYAGEGGEGGLVAHATSMGPGDQDCGCGDGPDAGLLDEAGGRAGVDELADPARVFRDLGVEGKDPLGEPDGLGARGCGGKVLLAWTPAGDLADLPGA